MISDNELMYKVQQGDTEKLGLLYERYHKPLYGYFFKLTGKQTISEDLVNDTFFKIIKNRMKFRGEGKFSIWMFKIAHSVFADSYKKIKHLVLTDEYPELSIYKLQSEDHSFSFDKEEEKEKLHKALLKLKKKEREILILSNFDGLRYKEIATILNCSEGAVKVRVFRALQNLKNIYINHQKEMP